MTRVRLRKCCVCLHSHSALLIKSLLLINLPVDRHQATRPPPPVCVKSHHHHQHPLVSNFHFHSFFFTSAASTATTTTAHIDGHPPTCVSRLYFHFSCFITLICVHPSICIHAQRIRVDLSAHSSVCSV